MRLRQSQRFVQKDLARRVVGEVGAAHHVADALRGVVHHHCQLIGIDIVRAQQHEIANRACNVLQLGPQPPVGPVRDGAGWHQRVTTQAPGQLRPAMQSGTAGSRVDPFAVPVACHTLQRQCRLDVRARTAAGVGQTTCLQT